MRECLPTLQGSELDTKIFHGLGLTISLTKTEVVVLNGSSSDTWHVGQHVLPRSASFKYLGIVFHESGGMTEALARLLQNGKGAAARLSAIDP